MKKTLKPKLCILLSLLLLLVLANANFSLARVQAANGTSANAVIDGFQVPYTADFDYPYFLLTKGEKPSIIKLYFSLDGFSHCRREKRCLSCISKELPRILCGKLLQLFPFYL